MRRFCSFLVISIFGLGCGTDPQLGSEGAPSSLARVLGAATIEACPQGGVDLEYGIDVNANGVLDDDEVNGSYSVCHGEPGEAGADGDGAAPGDRCQPARPHSASWRISSLCLLRAPWLPLLEPAPFRLQHKERRRPTGDHKLERIDNTAVF